MSNKGKIRVKGIQCPRCEQKVASLFRHDFKYCGCGYCFIDGGQEDYVRTGWGVGLPDGMENDGTVPKEVWEKVNAETAAIGRPKHINFYIKGKRIKKIDNFPGYDFQLFRALEETNNERKEQQGNRSKVRGTRKISVGSKQSNKRNARVRSKKKNTR